MQKYAALQVELDSYVSLKWPDHINKTKYKGPQTYYLWDSESLGKSVIYSMTATERKKSIECSIKANQLELSLVNAQIARDENKLTNLLRWMGDVELIIGHTIHWSGNSLDLFDKGMSAEEAAPIIRSSLTKGLT